MIIQEPVQAAIWHCLNHYDHKDAVFLAERLCSEIESDETVYILATSYYRSRLLHQAYWLLKEKSRRSPQCRFLQARCAYELKKYAEAESSLTNSNFSDLKDFEEISKEFGDIACFALQLIAQICLKTERTSIASSALRKALKLNPFMWQAYVELCNIGEDIDAAATFQIENTSVFENCQSNLLTNSMIIFNSNSNSNGSNSSSSGVNNVANSNCSNVKATLNDSTNQLINNTTMGTAATAGLDDVSNNNNGNGTNLLCTPLVFIDQQFQENSLHTPNNNIGNNSSLNGSMTILRGNHNNLGSSIGTGGGGGGGNSDSSFVTIINEQNLAGGGVDGGGGGGGSGDVNDVVLNLPFELNSGTPFRRQFKYLSAISPTTPSFGVLPLHSPCPNESSLNLSCGGGAGAGINNSLAMSNISSQFTQLNNSANLATTPNSFIEVVASEQETTASKKSCGNNGQLRFVARRDTAYAAGGHSNNSSNKMTVFAQAGNTTPRTPINAPSSNAVKGSPLQNAALRRSSRLFSNSAYSVKENNKSPNVNGKFAQPRSPPRKSKLRINKFCLNNKLIDDKQTLNSAATERVGKKNKEKIETITSPHNAAGGGGGGVGGGNTSTLDSKVQLNNCLNSAQSLSHHLLALKKQSADGLMALLRDLGEGYKMLARFQCKQAIQHFEATIPKHHLCSSWLQSLIGNCKYELREYEAAVSIFKRVHEIEPYRLEYMEIYSSSLWHLQKEVELSALAQDLINQDRTSSVTWCVAGNCFSLHKEHETAIKFFKRAVQVDPDFVYSYTLLGHELVLTEELEKALDYFRAAVVRDPRHYNAWFGIGTIYSKQEKYELAELHYIKALKINPQNSVILVHIGAMQYFMQRKEQALHTLNTAAALDPKNPLARFHRGSIYYSLGRHQEALRELEELKELVPKESVVFYLIGKIHKTLGNVDLALMHFSWATDLDPKGANTQMKDAFDSVTYPTCYPANANETAETEADLDAAGDVEGDGDNDGEPTSERSDYSTQTPNDINYDSDYL